MIKRFKADGLSGNKQAKIKDNNAMGAEIIPVGAKADAKMTSK